MGRPIREGDIVTWPLPLNPNQRLLEADEPRPMGLVFGRQGPLDGIKQYWVLWPGGVITLELAFALERVIEG